ncbi:hypothetical protein BJX63DRAFT_436472 [Aspergillus granulosus]|uniref:FAD dependent oxidoreductase domain-containing protein n=1 Tax=Aspergillus granulosus TaxID=176169 RepID=A0ABR4GY00_9EURO
MARERVIRLKKRWRLSQKPKWAIHDKSVVTTPAIFLPWLQRKLEVAGVKFVRKDLKSLSDLKGFGHEVLMNATGFGSKFLTDIADQNILRRVHENLPQVFPGTQPEEFDVIRDNVGVRPGRAGGVRVEKEIVNGEKIVHAYGTEGGYVFIFGLARAAATMVNDLLFAPPKSRL